MKIIINHEKNIEIEVPENPTIENIVDVLSENELVKDIFKEVGKESYFETFPYDNEMSDELAKKIAGAHLSNTEDALYQLYMDNDWDRKAPDYFNETNMKKDLKHGLSDILDSIVEHTEFSENEILDALLDEDISMTLKETMYDAMYEADKSTIEKSIPSHAKIEMTYIPDTHVLYIDDMYPSYNDVCFSAYDARPSNNLMRILKFFNVSPEEFIEECKNRGWDPTNPEIPENTADYKRKDLLNDALTWKAILEIKNETNHFIRQLPLPTLYEIGEWNGIVDTVRDGKDIDRPTAVSMDDLFTIMNNATSGGVASFTARIPLRDIVSGVLDNPISVVGGQIGINDFINGSGYVTTLENKLVLDPSKGRFSTRTIDDVYGIVGSYYNTDITPIEVDGWVHIKENKWVKYEEQKSASIDRQLDTDGNEEFWVLTKNADGDLAGPRETSEVFTSLDDAKKDVENYLSPEWEEDVALKP